MPESYRRPRASDDPDREERARWEAEWEERSARAQETIERRPESRMTRYVWQIISDHPALAPIREARLGRPTVSATLDDPPGAGKSAIYLSAQMDPGGSGWLFVEGIRGDWYRPLTQAHGREIADELAARMLATWTAWVEAGRPEVRKSEVVRLVGGEPDGGGD